MEQNYSYIGNSVASAALDFFIGNFDGGVLALSFFDRSEMAVRALGAEFRGKNSAIMTLSGGGESAKRVIAEGDYDVFVAPVDSGFDPFWQCLVVNKEIGNTMFLTSDEKSEQASALYLTLMHRFDLPLLGSWSEALLDEFNRLAGLSGSRQKNGILRELYVIPGVHSPKSPIALAGREVPLENVRGFTLGDNATDTWFTDTVSSLLKRKEIRIAESEQEPLNVKDMNSYFNMYGPKIVQNLERQMTPLVGLEGNVTDFTLKHKRLFPQQAAMVHGAKALLCGVGNKKERRRNHSNYAILNEGMGTGKTLQAASICEALGVAAALQGKSLEDVYREQNGANYRNIVMCPGHLVEKWAEEIRSEVPYARVEVLHSLGQLVKIRERGIKRCGREFYVISKDFAKLSYAEIPIPTKRREAPLKVRTCLDCGLTVSDKECECGSRRWKSVPTRKRLEGMICPHCNTLLVPYRRMTIDDEAVTLDAEDFAEKRADNERCIYCGESLWQPCIKNYCSSVFGKTKESPWVRATHYANKAHKGKKTVWVHNDYQALYFAKVGEQPLSYPPITGVRRFAPGAYIKKHLKGFFDVAIFDEVHTLKGGATAQGNVMHSLIKASKRQLALTGTIAGGYAEHLFYLLYRLEPHRMKAAGYDWKSVNRFSDAYGCVERVYAAEEQSGRYNSMSKGKQLSSAKCKPGISPRIFTDFLMDRTLFLDISDMSKYLPKLKEEVVLVEGVPPIQIEYRRVVDNLKQLSQSGGLGMSILGSMLQFSLSFLDKPYGAAVIKHPFSGVTLMVPKSFDMYADVDVLLPKEQKLVEIINKEQSEGRCCFVYAEYTGSPETCVSHRLKEVIEKHCNLTDREVTILESASPCASEREEWMHKKAAQGTKVFITNARCVETGRALASAA